MKTRSPLTRERLDQTVIDIEFLLIAAVQGLALTTLAVESEGIIGDGQWLYWPYVIAGFLLVMNFWAQAIMHCISFISWPFDMVHTVLYFLVTFVEVAAFSQLTQPEKWFLFMFAFFASSLVLYAWDYKMVRDKQVEFEDTPARQRLYQHIYRRQRIEFFFLLPAAVFFNGLIVIALWRFPDLVIESNHHVIPVTLQAVVGLIYLVSTIRAFKERERLLNDSIDDEVEAVKTA